MPLTLAVPSASWAQERCEPVAACVVSVQGTVELQRVGTAVWAVATLDEALCLGDTIWVGRASRAALVLANDALLRLDQRTTLALRGVAEERRSLLDLFFGAVYFFSHQPRALAVDTPFVNAAAEGTEFLVRVADDRAEVIMLDGQVLLQNPEGELRVARGDAAVVLAGAAPAPMIVARPRDAVAWALYYPPVLAALAERRARPRALPPGLQAAIDAVTANDYAGALDALDAVPEAARDARYWTYRAGVLLNVGRVDEAQAAIARSLALNFEAGKALAERAIIGVVQIGPRKPSPMRGARSSLSPNSGAAAVARSYALQANFQLEAARDVLRQASARAPGDTLVFARLSDRAVAGRAGRGAGSGGTGCRARPGAGAHADGPWLRGADPDRHRPGQGGVRARDRAGQRQAARPPRPGTCHDPPSDLEAGLQQIEIAAGLDPNNLLIRSYLGKAYFTERRKLLAGEQYAIAKDLDPLDPTAFLYDAILKQSQGRPGEALQDIQRSIELNDNRAVYRSRLLLDSDRAARGTGLALIYDNLGFLQPGINEASKSLTLDPANAGAHRFLSDMYLGVRRREIARVSNLLQAQMLQDININPVQPSLSEANLNLITQGGRARAGFNEVHTAVRAQPGAAERRRRGRQQ